MPGATEPLGERLTRVEQRVASHEERCEERMVEIRDNLKSLKTRDEEDRKSAADDRKVLNRTLIALVLAILAFLGKEVWYSRGGIVAGAAAISVGTANKE